MTDTVITTRTKCPFYGFSLMGSVMTDSKGNQCALKVDSHSPCSMQYYRNCDPNWNDCTLFNSTDYEFVLENVRVFPAELCPEGGKPWRGIKLREWFKMIVDQ